MFIGMRVCPLRYEIEAGERLASARYAGHKTDSLALVPLGRFDDARDRGRCDTKVLCACI